jgi:hypothetical protein
MEIFNDYKLYQSYKKIIRQNRVTLEANYGIRIDSANRLYTVINIPQSQDDEAYNLRKQDIDRLAESYIKEYINKLSLYLNSIGLGELYNFYEPIKKLEKHSYLIVLGFSKINSVELNRNLYFRLYPLIGISILIYLIIYYFQH